jgi:hypothetical protein
MGFHADDSKRHIRCCHFDPDEFYSWLRIIYRKRRDPYRRITFSKG